MSYEDNVRRIVDTLCMPTVDSMSQYLAGLLNQQDAPALTSAKRKLQGILNILDISVLESNDRACRKDAYINGHHPLLTYSEEALAKYACVIYRYVFPHFGAVELTEEQYVTKWTAPYTELKAQLASKADSFISQLTVIADNPVVVPNVIIEPKYDMYVQIKDFLAGNDDFFTDLNDFLFNTFSPLRKDSVTDERVIALVTEVNTLRAKYNKKLEAFAIKHSDFTEKTGEMHVPSKTKNKKGEIVYLKNKKGEIVYNAEKISYKVPDDKILYGREMRRCRKLVKDCKSFRSLRPTTVSMLTAHKDKISAVDWDVISQAMESKVLTPAVRKVIAANLKAIKNAIKQASAPVIAEPVDLIANNEAFISGFMLQLGIAYAIPVAKNPEEPTTQELLDDAYTTIDALYTANTQGTTFDAVQSQQKANEEWYSNFNNISQSLAVCLQITLNKLSPSAVLSEKVLNHGAIQGLLAFAKQVRNPDVNAYDYSGLSNELRHQIQSHTDYYTEVALLPKIELMSNGQLIDAKDTMTAPVLILPSLFDLTPPIHKVMARIHASVVTTAVVELLSAKDIDIQSLVPVPDVTIKEIATMLTGQPSTPYLLDGKGKGDLIFNIDGTDKYVKPVPTIADGNYKDKTYHFRAYNWNVLTGHIHDLQQLLKRTPEYIEWQNPSKEKKEQEQEQEETQEQNGVKPLPKDFSYKLLPKDALSRKDACDEANALYDFLFAMAEGIYANNEEMQEYLEQLNQIHSFKDLYINGKRLAAWVFYTEKYRLISDPPVDATTGKVLDYEPDHLDGDPSNNSKPNLEIKLKQANLDARSTSHPVIYNGHRYPTTTKYCKAFGLSYDYVNRELKKLQLGDIFDSNGRLYSLNPDGRSYTAVDSQTKAPKITYNGVDYDTPKAFATSLKLNYSSLNNALNDARKAGELKFERKFKNKKYTFYLDEKGNIIKIV
ncbi:hypothetical protein [Clostridium beijerinckii]|uniref:Uncharacterized protein n=1 Tax=Clostridium beijerinckii TaxID=1520 RepID=A0AAW3W5R6_CLOBE|nr:hypothetical protein [Clostridium beijerinckii]MBC2457142.1 hypothetical protein [Clostridium beijerinckii]MBC2474199.1 hypothetical protein [Clostridium beijerinckii]NOV58702.1 hypothetical protein [Clostridium beijerinckii]NOV71913.1 hypothetical protein [Clostridium beijerinckii]NOW32057.1 hypothetical protein [Clostridium beijerinckii]